MKHIITIFAPWMHLTPDLQIIEPGFKSVDSPVVVGGLRLVLDL